jgi:DNA-binding transcriptional LysR family regulator
MTPHGLRTSSSTIGDSPLTGVLASDLGTLGPTWVRIVPDESLIKWFLVICGITAVNLSGIDVNLLVAFDALVHERSVTRAATRVGLSQPAMSNALSRLRALFGDPLLVRVGREMSPTRHALDLAGPIHRALADLQHAVDSTTTFDPARSARTIRLALTDYVATVLLPTLIRCLTRTAPGIDIETQPLDGTLPAGELRSGRLDLAFGNFPQPVSSPLRQHALFREGFVCLVRRGHPVVRTRLTLRRFVALDHVLVSPRGERSGVVDRLLGARGLRRRVAFTTSHFMVAPTVVSQTNLITTVPRRAAEALGRRLRLRLFEPPLRIPPFEISMVWHGRTDEEPLARWFRDEVRRLCATL